MRSDFQFNPNNFFSASLRIQWKSCSLHFIASFSFSRTYNCWIGLNFNCWLLSLVKALSISYIGCRGNNSRKKLLMPTDSISRNILTIRMRARYQIQTQVIQLKAISPEYKNHEWKTPNAYEKYTHTHTHNHGIAMSWEGSYWTECWPTQQLKLLSFSSFHSHLTSSSFRYASA